MYKLTVIIYTLILIIPLSAQSPHGDNFKLDCSQCHDPSGWTVSVKTVKFDHNSTNFALEGVHAQTDCKNCHSSLIFGEARQECIGCHTDIHQATAGNDCDRCHNTKSWLVTNISEIHEEFGFPLAGVHSIVNCDECHNSETNLLFNPIGNECINCHQKDFLGTTEPNHVTAGFSTNCTECHDLFGFGWNSGGFNHDFFLLTQGHKIQACDECHITSSFSDASPECYSCHQEDFNQTINPNHNSLDFDIECNSCHTTNPGWSPASFDIHNEFYQLNGAHALIANECDLCHNSDYTNTPNTCLGCHINDYNSTTDPNHTSEGFPTECDLCHTESSWEPADFDHDDTDFPLFGGHIGVDCKTCHVSGYTGTSTECSSCHISDYNSTTDPNHASEGFPTQCGLCHTESSWEPSTFDHDAQYFPIYGGKHRGEWSSCADCHQNSSNYGDFSCFACHRQSSTDRDHSEVSGYQYVSSKCLQCHPDGRN
jgi:hypothetical protein